MVERNLPKVEVAGSNPVSRSIFCVGGAPIERLGIPVVCRLMSCPLIVNTQERSSIG